MLLPNEFRSDLDWSWIRSGKNPRIGSGSPLLASPSLIMTFPGS